MDWGRSIAFVVSAFLWAFSPYALVDYTDAALDDRDAVARESVAVGSPVFTKRPPAPSGRWALALGYRRVGTGHDRADADIWDVAGHFGFGNLYMDVGYWTGSATGQGGSKGNPTVVLGMKWLQETATGAGLDILLGSTFGTRFSELASSRDDRHIGMVTTKSFGPVSLNLGYILTMVGAPKNPEEMAVGNIRKAYASLGLPLGGSVDFFLETGAYQIASSSYDRTGGSDLHLEEGASFGYLSPKALFGLGKSALRLQLGALFRTKRLKGDGLARARLWELEGSYGNSVFARLDFSL